MTDEKIKQIEAQEKEHWKKRMETWEKNLEVVQQIKDFFDAELEEGRDPVEAMPDVMLTVISGNGKSICLGSTD